MQLALMVIAHVIAGVACAGPAFRWSSRGDLMTSRDVRRRPDRWMKGDACLAEKNGDLIPCRVRAVLGFGVFQLDSSPVAERVRLVKPGAVTRGVYSIPSVDALVETIDNPDANVSAEQLVSILKSLNLTMGGADGRLVESVLWGIRNRLLYDVFDELAPDVIVRIFESFRTLNEEWRTYFLEDHYLGLLVELFEAFVFGCMALPGQDQLYRRTIVTAVGAMTCFARWYPAWERLQALESFAACKAAASATSPRCPSWPNRFIARWAVHQSVAQDAVVKYVSGIVPFHLDEIAPLELADFLTTLRRAGRPVPDAIVGRLSRIAASSNSTSDPFVVIRCMLSAQRLYPKRRLDRFTTFLRRVPDDRLAEIPLVEVLVGRAFGVTQFDNRTMLKLDAVTDGRLATDLLAAESALCQSLRRHLGGTPLVQNEFRLRATTRNGLFGNEVLWSTKAWIRYMQTVLPLIGPLDIVDVSTADLRVWLGDILTLALPRGKVDHLVTLIEWAIMDDGDFWWHMPYLYSAAVLVARTGFQVRPEIVAMFRAAIVKALNATETATEGDDQPRAQALTAATPLLFSVMAMNFTDVQYAVPPGTRLPSHLARALVIQLDRISEGIRTHHLHLLLPSEPLAFAKGVLLSMINSTSADWVDVDDSISRLQATILSMARQTVYVRRGVRRWRARSTSGRQSHSRRQQWLTVLEQYPSPGCLWSAKRVLAMPSMIPSSNLTQRVCPALVHRATNPRKAAHEPVLDHVPGRRTGPGRPDVPEAPSIGQSQSHGWRWSLARRTALPVLVAAAASGLALAARSPFQGPVPDRKRAPARSLGRWIAPAAVAAGGMAVAALAPKSLPWPSEPGCPEERGCPNTPAGTQTKVDSTDRWHVQDFWYVQWVVLAATTALSAWVLAGVVLEIATHPCRPVVYEPPVHWEPDFVDGLSGADFLPAHGWPAGNGDLVPALTG